MPSITSRRIWKKALKILLRVPENSLRTTEVDIGSWKECSTPFLRWWYDEFSCQLFHKEAETKYSIWKYVEGRTNTRYSYGIYFKINDSVPSVAQSACPIDVMVIDRDRVRITSKGTLWLQHQGDTTDQVSRIASWPIKYVEMPVDGGRSFVEEVGNNDGKVVCDGSFLKGTASSAFVTISAHEICGGNILPGSSKYQSAYRRELGGLLGAIVFTKYICNQWHISAGKVTIGCDCKGALAVLRKNGPINSQWDSYDLVSRISRELRETNIIFAFKYIKGHQDIHKQQDELDEWEQANVKADWCAKHYMQLYGKVNQGVVPLVGDGDMWTISFEG